MAGEWIKFRNELFTHPRFIKLYTSLIYDEEHNSGLLRYVVGDDALNIGVIPPSDKPLLDVALRGVTERALRDVTMVLLLRVWCAVNAHCKVDGTDAICEPMSLLDLADISGVDCFGDALLEAGWVIEDEDNNRLIFKNFLEHNTPSCLRPTPMTNAERQRLFRQRQSLKNSTVTTVTKSNGDKRREEKSTTPSVLVESLASDGKSASDGSLAVAKPASKAPFHSNGKETDDEWLKKLESVQAYQGINIPSEWSKMSAWCSVNGKQPSRKRFINWLNRCEKPMKVDGVKSTALQRKLREIEML